MQRTHHHELRDFSVIGEYYKEVMSKKSFEISLISFAAKSILLVLLTCLFTGFLQSTTALISDATHNGGCCPSQAGSHIDHDSNSVCGSEKLSQAKSDTEANSYVPDLRTVWTLVPVFVQDLFVAYTVLDNPNAQIHAPPIYRYLYEGNAPPLS